MQLSLGALARQLELPTESRPLWRNTLSQKQCDTLAVATGVPPDVLCGMTLSAYDGTALRLDPDSKRPDTTFPFGPLTWSRYCPDCLNESRGRWQLAWRLGWSFACLRHSLLLADCCLSCGRRQRQLLSYGRAPTPTRCRCGAILTATPTFRFPPDHVIVEAQRLTFEVIHGGRVVFGVFATGPFWPQDALRVVRSFANRVLNHPASGDWLRMAISDSREGTSAGEATVPTFQGRSTLNDKAPSRAIETAVGVSLAMQILLALSIGEAGRRARRLFYRQSAATGPTELRSCIGDAPLAAAIMLRASEVRLGPELQLRYRTAVTVPCVPDLDAGRVRSMAAALPSAMWPAWSARLLPDLRRTAVARSTLSCATLLAGSTIKPAAAASLLGSTVTANAMNSRLWVLCGSAYWLDICAALIRLSDYLDEEGAPIDYGRRRRLDYSALFNEGYWGDLPSWRYWDGPGNGDSTTAHARYYLVGRLMGTSPLSTNVAVEVPRSSARSHAVPSPRARSADVYAALDVCAESFLARLGIDEPVVWHPPLDLIDDLELPESASK